MKKITLLMLLFTLVCGSVAISQEENNTKFVNYGNWSTNSSNSHIGIGLLPTSVSKLDIMAHSNYDWIRFVPSAYHNEIVWRFHNPLEQRMLHIGYRDEINAKDYWNLTLSTDNAFVGINNINPQAALDINGGVIVRIKGNILANFDKSGIYFGTEEKNITVNFNGLINANHIEVSLNSWPDYVFDTDYNLMTLGALEQFIKENNHLPGVPSQKDVIENGIDLGEMDSILLQKIEELTIYIIELEKRINSNE